MPSAHEIPYITLSRVVGGVTERRQLPVELDRGGAPIPVGLTPDVAFPDSIVFGDSTKRSDQRTAQIIHDDWTGGAGEEEYTETEGINTFTDSGLDTRFQKSLVLPPQPTQLGGTLPSYGVGQKGLYLGYPNARYLTFGPYVTGGYTYNPTNDTWNLVAGVGAMRDACIVGRYAFAMGVTALYRTTDGVTWESCALPAVSGGAYRLIEQYDNKLCILYENQGVATLYFTTAYTGTAAAITWTAGGTFVCGDATLNSTDPPQDLFTWRLPTNTGYPALWCRTATRLLYYEDQGGANVWHEWETLTRIPWSGTPAPVIIWKRNGNLYAVPRGGLGRVAEYTGSTQDVLGPNERGGLPVNGQSQFYALDANGHFLVAFGDASYKLNGTGPIRTEGRVWAMSDGHAWHCLYRVANAVSGGWLGPETICVVGGLGTVYELPFADDTTIPRNATKATYRNDATYYLETAWTDGGTPYVNKRALWLFLDARLPSGASGVPPGTYIGLEFMTDKSTTWQTLASFLTDSSTWPYVAPFLTGATITGRTFKRIKFRIGLTTSVATVTPNVTNLTLSFVRRPRRRYSHTVRIDLRNGAPAFRDGDRRFNGYTAANLRTWLLGLNDNDDGAGGDDPLVKLEYGGDGDLLSPTRRVVNLADVVISPVEDPEDGLGRYSLTLRDLTPPSSG